MNGFPVHARVNRPSEPMKRLFTPDKIHLSKDGGYEFYASKRKPPVARLPRWKGGTTW